MERDELLSRSQKGSPRGIDGSVRRIGPVPKLSRQVQQHCYDSFWSAADVGTAISRDLIEKAERWKLLANEPLLGSPQPSGFTDGHRNSEHFKLPEERPLISNDLNKYEVASHYVKDALAGRESAVCIHDKKSLEALKLVRNKTWNHVLNVCTILNLALPMLEVQRCLPCMGPQPVVHDSDALWQGWRPTTLGSMWVECLLCILYAYDLYLVSLSSNHVHERIDNSASGDKEKPRRRYLSKLPPWQLARTVMVFLLGIGLLSNMTAHYLFRTTWHRWSRVTLPFLFMSRRTYLKHFVGGIIRVLPRMVPVVFLMSFVMFFYAFLGFIIYRDEPKSAAFLGKLELFSEPTSSAMTFLRMFMSISFMLDVEELYEGRKFIRPLGLSYGVIMVIFLGALVPAVANRNFQYQSRESYQWVNEQRKLALTRAYFLFKRSDGTVGRDDWVSLMTFLRPDCSTEHTSALFDAAQQADAKMNESSRGQTLDTCDDRLSKGGFFMLCALGKATFSKPKRVKYQGTWGRFRKRLDSALSWPFPGMTLPFSRLLLYVMIVIQAYQMVRAGDDREHRPAWADTLGGWLIAYFCVFASLRMLAEGIIDYLMHWGHAWGMTLNLIGVAYNMGFWFRGETWHSVYHILQASRLMILWNVFHMVNPTSAEVAKRLEFVFPAVLRSSFVLFSVIYSCSIVASAMYCATALGIYPIDSVATNPMVQRFAFYRHSISFASLPETFAALTNVVMLSNWPIFMDAAGEVGNATIARIFFFSFKGLTFYFVMPVMLGFIVQSYMAAKLPGTEPNAQPFMPRATSKSCDTDPGTAMNTSITGSINGSGRGVGTSVHRDDSFRSYNGSNFGYSTLADGSETQIEVVPEEVGEEGSADEEDDDMTPVLVTSHKRSMSQAFWGAEQARDQEGTQEKAKQDSTLQDTFEHLARLERENFSLRAEINILKMELPLAKVRLYDELEQNSGESSPEHHSTPPSWLARRAAATSGGAGGGLQDDAPARMRIGSASSAKGMEAIVESDEESNDAGSNVDIV